MLRHRLNIASLRLTLFGRVVTTSSWTGYGSVVNSFIEKFEKKALETAEEGPSAYNRYVYDTFVVFYTKVFSLSKQRAYNNRVYHGDRKRQSARLSR